MRWFFILTMLATLSACGGGIRQGALPAPAAPAGGTDTQGTETQINETGGSSGSSLTIRGQVVPPQAPSQDE